MLGVVGPLPTNAKRRTHLATAEVRQPLTDAVIPKLKIPHYGDRGHRLRIEVLDLTIRLFPSENVISQHRKMLFRFRSKKRVFFLEDFCVQL